ncbi:3TM-type holin [Eilatimonas milleporae]|uniref:Holin (3TMs family) n=1 Tax=Eilatimonas milleporae TaxID=911205 RepID=A0A3M0CWX4_9PROT|nr:3TM-type holin [Eilatimonas milleporae]RMB11949.1 holin (3TMs family) [Eilatimonas milleporae]
MIGLLDDLIGGLFGIVGKAVVDKDKVRQAEHDIRKLVMSSHLAQIAVNRQEAAHASLLVAGWRPFIGWVCGFSLLYKFILYPFLQFALVVFTPDFPVDQLPRIEAGEMTAILMGMLGLGGMRTYEKLKGVSRER